jgi:SulP family sulfate permease
MQYMDQSGLYTLEDVLIDLLNSNIEVLFVDVLDQPRYMMERVGLIPDLIPLERIFDTFDECITYLNNKTIKQKAEASA